MFPSRKNFSKLIREGVQTVGLETMEGIKSRIYEGIVQQEEKDKGNGHLPLFSSYHLQPIPLSPLLR
jgi:hypothetical protein